MTEIKRFRWRKWGWITALVLLMASSVTVVFGLTDDSLVDGQGSDLVREFAYEGSGSGDGSAAEQAQFSNRFGEPGEAVTLVVYDQYGEVAPDAELYGLAAGNLATHFGEVEVIPADEYESGKMSSFDGVIYAGASSDQALPAAFLSDVRNLDTPVLWLGRNIEQLAATQSADGESFEQQYGWDPNESVAIDSTRVKSLEYQGQSVRRNTDAAGEVAGLHVSNADVVDVVVESNCTNRGEPIGCTRGGDSAMPWALRSEGLTYFAEVPMDYLDTGDLYLIFADVLYGLLGSDKEAVQQAAVRLEDVGPEADPEDLRAVADYLASENVPFQVAVMPIHIARTPDGEDWYGVSLLDRPEVADALKYMQTRGGTLIQHGTTHQYGDVDNPYSGRTGEDYEFYRYGCTPDQLPPFEFEECVQDSYIRELGPVRADSVSDHVNRIEAGREVMIEAGLGEPTVFETPHYAASPNAYAAMTEVYGARYESSNYFAGALSGINYDEGIVYGQYFPYVVHDFYGSTVYPETLGNISEVELNNHAPRDPAHLLRRAEANLIVRESTASFFFHPYLSRDYLEAMVEGLQDMGYTFVPVTDLQ